MMRRLSYDRTVLWNELVSYNVGIEYLDEIRFHLAIVDWFVVGGQVGWVEGASGSLVPVKIVSPHHYIVLSAMSFLLKKPEKRGHFAVVDWMVQLYLW
jgi:hypothetical protein